MVIIVIIASSRRIAVVMMMKMMMVWNANSNEIIDAHHVRIVVTFNHSYHSCRNSRGGAEGGG